MDGPVRTSPTSKKARKRAPEKAAESAEAADETSAEAADQTSAEEAAPPKGAPAAAGPAFASAFPRDPRLQRLVALFEQGNYAAVHADGRALIQSSKDEAVRAAANELITRTKPDPLALYLLAIAAALLAILAGWYWTHPHQDAPPAAQPPAASPVST
jgi:hypothetical protein